MNYSLGIKRNPFMQASKDENSSAGGFSLASVIRSVQTVFQNLVGSFVGGLRKLGFGSAASLGSG
jgi:hypothetical protein